MKTATLIARILLGLIYLLFGINFFFPFIPADQPKMTEAATAFSGGLYGSGYFFQYMKVLEILGGIALLINRFTAFFLLVLLPISLNIFLYHAMLAPAGVAMGAGIIALNLFLCVAYFKYYSSVFTFEPKV
jgi:putative oxidoreductase